MKESISINNFLVVKKADLEVKKINVIIGPQANGKSIIAKLLYFFKSISNDFIDGIRSNKSKRALDLSILNDFEKRFPRYSWEGDSFQIVYKIGELELKVLGIKNSRGKTKLKFEYSKELQDLYNGKKKIYNKKLEEARESNKKQKWHQNIEFPIFYEHVRTPINNSVFNSFFSNSVFVPASRSFFANLQKNIFTFLASNLDIDPFLKEFGSLYETSKRWYKDSYLAEEHRELINELYKDMEAIVDGEYEYKDDQDWIHTRGNKINLANASSGQQESLPMLLTLCVWPLIRHEEKGGMFFIEEPEAHLFPTSQGHIVSILSLLYSMLGTNFFLTSHSPYILSALNNFILAGDAVDRNSLSVEGFTKMNGSGRPINFEDVAAYTITNGKVSSINDEEYRMLGADMLDGVSEHFETVMNKILVCGD
ncbi:AAA family ATPase [Shewanella insulae]|uniref:AAA family ATPase n=1 Tax=Shewanella insulae TaxID=2681496 RepID=UPI00248070ED|nr:AAA family ATPase [Shewanella insulae]